MFLFRYPPTWNDHSEVTDLKTVFFIFCKKGMNSENGFNKDVKLFIRFVNGLI